MDFQNLVDLMAAMTCVVSVEKLDNGRYGKIRIVTGNKSYIDSIEHPAPGVKMLVDKFVPNSEYTDYLTRDLNFEDYCYRAAVEKKCLHSYAHPERMQGIWFNMTFLPISYEEGNLCYCTYSMEINFEADTEKLSGGSAGVTEQILKIAILLRNSKDFQESMNDVIKGIRDICEAEHCCILLMDTYDRKCSVLCEAFGEGSKLLPMNTYVNDEFYDIADSWSDLIAGSNCLIAKNDQDMEVVKERNPEWYKSITDAGGKSIVLFPIKFQDKLLGYIWAINFNAQNETKIKEILETTTVIIGSEISNYSLLDRLKILSSKDMLTGVMNRNEMNNYVDKLSEESEGNPNSIAVIFADLNGLKRINDDFGHSAGDKLLRDAAKALEEVFKPEEIFRAGGDEFTIIIRGLKEGEIESRVEQVREASKKYENVCFAIGTGFDSNKENIRRILKLADQRMYEDKRKYYELHPEKKRRD